MARESSFLARWRNRGKELPAAPCPVIPDDRQRVIRRPLPFATPLSPAKSRTTALIIHAKTILVMNSKGGSGKTTVSTNIATMLAAHSKNNRIVLVDHDPQGSSAHWLRVRSPRHRKIEGLFPAKDNVIKFKRTWRLQVDKSATHIIVDSAAGLSNFDLTDRIRECDLIIVPVMPSAIDIAATSNFISKIFVNPAYINSNKKMAVIANGVDHDLYDFNKLERFLFSLRIPFLSVFSSHSRYLLAAERGCGVNELPSTRQPFHDLPEWDKLLGWIEED